MARSLSLSLYKTYLSTTIPRSTTTTPPRLLLPLRGLSNQPSHSDQSELSESSADPLLRKLEDAIHQIIVRRSAPDWLPFLPGSSYWVPPPKSQAYGLAQLVEKLANPMSQEESMSVTSDRGWPSSDYFIKGEPPHPVEVETPSPSNNVSKPEEEEG